MATLLLNSDASPVTMIPLSILSWEDAVKYMVLEKATVLDWYDNWIIHSQKWQTAVPAVMILKEYQKKKATIRYSKSNVFLRDNYTCQYCLKDLSKRLATLDHILPISHGGRTSWENTTTACAGCNAMKGNDKRVVPKNKPYKPTYFQLVEKRKKLGWEKVPHPSWLNYLE